MDASGEDPYTVALLEKSGLLRGVPDLGQLDTLGLSEGADYLKLSAVIRDGVISSLGDQTVSNLDESKLTYTIAESTNMTITKPSGIAPGEMFMVRAAFEMDPAKGRTAQSVQLALPEGILPAGGDLALVDGVTQRYSYDPAARTVAVPVSGRSGVVYLYCMASGAAGTHILNGDLETDGGVQPIGTALVRVEKRPPGASEHDLLQGDHRQRHHRPGRRRSPVRQRRLSDHRLCQCRGQLERGHHPGGADLQLFLPFHLRRHQFRALRGAGGDGGGLCHL